MNCQLLAGQQSEARGWQLACLRSASKWSLARRKSCFLAGFFLHMAATSLREPIVQKDNLCTFLHTWHLGGMGSVGAQLALQRHTDHTYNALQH